MVLREVLKKYPWIEDTKQKQEIFSELGISLDLDVLLKDKSPILDEIFLRIKSIIEDGLNRREELTEYIIDEKNVILFPILKLIITSLKDKSIIHQVANVFSKHINRLLFAEKKHGLVDYSKLISIAQSLGWEVEQFRVKIGSQKFDFQMSFEKYIPLSAKFKDPAWKITNQKLERGYICLYKENLIRLFEENCKERILSAQNEQDRDIKEKIRQSATFGSFISQIEEIIDKKRNENPLNTNFSQISKNESMFPPCVQILKNKLSQGINLNHIERLFFAFFLLNYGYNVEQVLDFFKNSPDYNDKIARYQIEHAAGEKGHKVQYKVHNCNKLKSYQMCYATHPEFGHPWCANTNPEKKPITNPMSFVRRKAWIMQKKVQEQNKAAEQTDEKSTVLDKPVETNQKGKLNQGEE